MENSFKVSYHKIEIKGINIFYRTAGDNNKQPIILLHGFPSASHMFRDLIPLLKDKFYLISHDYPGVGQSDSPNRKEFEYSFLNISSIIEDFINIIAIHRLAIYVFDY